MKKIFILSIFCLALSACSNNIGGEKKETKEIETEMVSTSSSIVKTREYLYPPLIEITDMPKAEVEKKIKINTIKERYRNNEITKEVYEAKFDRAEKGIKEPEVKRGETTTTEEIATSTEEEIKDKEIKIK